MRYFLVMFVLAQISNYPSEYAKSVIKALPTWEADALAIYEQAELEQVRKDLENEVDDDTLRADWQALEVLDKALQVRYVI